MPSKTLKVEELGDLDLPKLLFLARASEAAERFEDMCEVMKTLVDKKVEEGTALTVEERNLLSVAYKNVVGGLRGSWRSLNEEREYLDIIEKYRKQVEESLSDVCEEIINILDEKLMKNASDVESKVFYLKMIGDYYRYFAEFAGADKHGTNAEKYYGQAWDIAKRDGDEGLMPIHPIRLGLALNYSVCFYEIIKDQKKACALAQQAFDTALIAKFDELDQESYKDAALIMQLLRDNLSLWTKEDDVDEAADGDAAPEEDPAAEEAGEDDAGDE